MSKPNPLAQTYQLGQSLWLDYIRKSILDGELQALIEKDSIMGLTSNPAIFEQAITRSDDYDAHMGEILAARPDIDNLELFNELAIADIQAAADAFADTYKTTDGLDGMVSLEVSPELADDADGTVASAVDLHERVSRPNLMIKVPGTKAGIDAFETLTAMGINVNVTLLFSVTRYREIAEAYIRGLAQRHADAQPIDRIASVASFFVSRVDSAVDEALESAGGERARALLGRIAIANARVAYGHFVKLFGSEQFERLAAAGARPQRLLWASTGTKNANYSDVLYVEELIGPDTVNTLPPATMDAFRDHGVAERRLTQGLEQAHADISALSELGISLASITDKLEADGVASFKEAFARLLESLAEKRQRTAS
ncbi:MAG: transaldolase [Gammaproteobacteria bacterium]|nr:MAG: transaldolase [Gammaproteobacteria bacterium]